MDLKTIVIAYAMAIVIGSLIYVPLAVVIGIFAALRKKVPIKTFLKKSILFGVLIGSAQGLTVVKKDIKKHQEGEQQTKKVISDKAVLQKRMSEIIDIVFNDNSKLPKLHHEFYSLLNQYVEGDDEKRKILKFNLSTAQKVYKNWVFKDAADSIKLGRVIKSARRQEIEKKMLEGNPSFQEQIDLDNSFISLVANKEPVNTVGDPIIYDETKIAEVEKKSNAKWSAVENLFEQPKP